MRRIGQSRKKCSRSATIARYCLARQAITLSCDLQKIKTKPIAKSRRQNIPDYLRRRPLCRARCPRTLMADEVAQGSPPNPSLESRPCSRVRRAANCSAVPLFSNDIDFHMSRTPEEACRSRLTIPTRGNREKTVCSRRAATSVDEPKSRNVARTTSLRKKLNP